MSNWLSGLRRFGSLSLIACAALIASSGLTHAQGFTITKVSTNSASFPAMAADANGNLNVVWIDSVKGLQFAHSTTSASGTALGTPVDVPGPGNTVAHPAFQPQIAVYMTQANVIEIVWAAVDPTSPPTAPLYDVFAGRSEQSGAAGTFVSMQVGGPVALFDSPRLAFDFSGKTNVVWGQHDVLITQAQDGLTFPPAVSLLPVTVPPTPLPDTGGPRIAVSVDNRIYVIWTDESAKAQTAPGNYCTNEITDANGTVTNTYGGNFWVNETVPLQTGSGVPSNLNTRSLSNNDWTGVNAKFPLGFFGCSYDNLSMFADGSGHIHLLWSDDTPFEDVLTSEFHGIYQAGSPFAGETQFSFPINLANHAAASPAVAVDKNGSFYVVWSGGPNPGPNSEGIFFSRSDDGGSTFTPGVNIAPSGSAALPSAFPQVAVDSSSNVNIAWEQPTAKISGDGSDVFNVFFARSTDRGNTFPTVLQVTTNPSVLCFKADPPPEGTGALPITPDVTTCGTVQLGVDANSTPDMVWVNQASGAAVADIDFATTNFPTGSVSPNLASLSASNTSATFTVTVNASGFSAPITFSCVNADTQAALPSWLSCGFATQPLNPAQSNTDTLTITRQATPTSGMFISAPPSHNLRAYGSSMAVTTALATMSLMAMLMLAMGRRRDLSRALVLRGFVVMTLTVVLAAGLVSCGGSTSKGTTGTTSSGGTTSGTGTGGGTTGGTGGSGGGTGGTGGTGGGSTVTMRVAVQATSGGSTTTLGTVTITAQ
jgi:hypothetical protein